MKKRVLIMAAFLFLCLGWRPVLRAQASFYQGKTIRIMVGFLAGDGYDIWARILAAHMDKQIPGAPAIIVQNMPGAGSAIAANYIYGVAKPEAAKKKLEADPSSGEEIEAVAKEAVSQSPDVIERMKKLLGK